MLKCVLIGPGRMGINYAKVIRQNPYAELVAICGNTKENTENNSKAFNVPLYFNNNWEEMFDRHPDVNSVFIATPEWAHLAPFKAALARDKNIVIEKPVVALESEYEQIVELVACHSKLKMLVCHTCRFDFRYAQAQKQILNGAIGDIGYIYSRRNTDVKTAERVAGKIPMAYWLTVHDIDLMRWFTQNEVKEVYALQSGKKERGNFLIVNLLFENGIRGVIEIVWLGAHISGQDATRMDIEGSIGKIEIKYGSPTLKQFRPDGNIGFDEWDMVNVHGKYHGSTPCMINHFVDVLTNKQMPLLTIHDGLKAVRVCNAIENSLKLKKVVEL